MELSMYVCEWVWYMAGWVDGMDGVQSGNIGWSSSLPFRPEYDCQMTTAPLSFGILRMAALLSTPVRVFISTEQISFTDK